MRNIIVGVCSLIIINSLLSGYRIHHGFAFLFSGGFFIYHGRVYSVFCNGLWVLGFGLEDCDETVRVMVIVYE